MNTHQNIYFLLQTCFCNWCFLSSGWSDGRLRGLGAESGRVLWTMDDAHYGGVNAVTALKTGFVVTGGRDGRVRLLPNMVQFSGCRPSDLYSALYSLFLVSLLNFKRKITCVRSVGNIMYMHTEVDVELEQDAKFH